MTTSRHAPDLRATISTATRLAASLGRPPTVSRWLRNFGAAIPGSRASSSTCTTQLSTRPSRACEKPSRRPFERNSTRWSRLLVFRASWSSRRQSTAESSPTVRRIQLWAGCGVNEGSCDCRQRRTHPVGDATPISILGCLAATSVGSSVVQRSSGCMCAAAASSTSSGIRGSRCRRSRCRQSRVAANGALCASASMTSGEI